MSSFDKDSQATSQQEEKEEKEEKEEASPGPPSYNPKYHEYIIDLSAPEGLFSANIHANKIPETQSNKATAMLQLIIEKDMTKLDKLTQTSLPIPVLVKVPGT